MSAVRPCSRGMTKVRVSTTVEVELLERARAAHAGPTDASLLEAALEALLREHRAGEVDRAYLDAYRAQPMDTRDEWGDLATFLDAAASL